MSEHKTTVSWTRTTKDFQYDTYERSHRVAFEGGQELNASAAADFKGKKELANPEEFLVAALSSCHMLTFLAIAARSRLTVNSYEDHAVGVLEKDSNGVMRVTRVALRPRIQFEGSVPPEKVREIHEKAHKNCFIANSVTCEVTVD